MDWLLSRVSDIPAWYCTSALASGYLLYYLLDAVKKPILACADGEFKRFLNTKIPLLKEKFWPTFWCFEARAQTVMAALVREAITPNINYRREILTMKDGGEVCLDWVDDHFTAVTPTMIILPGLTGGSQAEYVKGLVGAANGIGLRAVVFSQRGIGGTLKTSKTFCATSTEDLEDVIQHVKSVCKEAPIAATGISMGALILGNYLCKSGQNAGLTSAMLISVPWNVPLGSKSIEKPIINLMLNRHLATGLCNIIRKGKDVLGLRPYEYDEIIKSKTIREFDTNFTTKHHGYDSIDDYYSAASLHDKVHLVSIPVLCLNAADDPFQPFDGIPVDMAEQNPNVGIVITSRGGHIGFMEGIWPAFKNQYMFRLFSQYFKAVLIEDGYKALLKPK